MKRVLFFEATISIVVVVFFVYGWQKQQNANAFYSNALRDANISEKIVVDGKKYGVVDGEVVTSSGSTPEIYKSKILRLAYAKTLARRSPLMALAGTDPDRLEIAINGLAKTRDVLSSMQKNPRDKALVMSSLYPISFLTSLANLERARIQFLASGDEIDEMLYKTAELKTLRSYNRDIGNFRRAFLRAVPENVRPFAAGGSVINRNELLDALDSLSHGVESTEIKFERRSNCLYGNISQCATADIHLPSISVRDESPMASDTLSRANRIRSIFARASDNIELLEGLMVKLSDSKCTKNIPGDPVFLPHRKQLKQNHLQYLWPLFVGDIPLIENSAQAQQFFQYFRDRGVKYVSGAPLTYYDCFENGYDFGKISGVYAIITFAKKSPVSVYATGKTKDGLENMERNLPPHSGLVTESDAAKYILLAYSLIQNSAMPEEIRNEIVSLSLQLENGSAKFDSLILEISRIENTNAILVQNGVLSIPFEIEYLFYTRSGFMPLLLENNPSATGLHTSFFERDTTPLDKQPFVFYSSLPHSSVKDDELIKYLEFYRRVHLNFGQETLSPQYEI